LKDDNQPPSSTWPGDSKIELRSTQDRFVLQTPPRGVHWPAIRQLIGGTLCLAISGQWTQRTLGAKDIGAASMALPFWLIGIGVVFGAARAMLKHHRIEISSQGGWIRLLPFGWKRVLNVDKLLVRFDQVTRGEADGRGGVDVPLLVIEDGSRVFQLMEGSSDEQRRWVRTELNMWLARRRHSF
jgi:hypothetical protein